MTPIPNRSKKSWAGPVSYILGILVVSIISLWLLSGRDPKQIDMIGTCNEITLPIKQTLQLPEFDSLHLRGFDLSLSNMNKFQIKTPSISKGWDVQAQEVKLNVNLERATEQPSFQLITKGARGADSYITFPEKTSLKGGEVNPDLGPVLTINLPDSNEGEINVKADQIILPEVNRMLVSNMDVPEWLKTSETFSISPIPDEHQLMNAHCTVIEKEKTELPQINIRFAKNSLSAFIYNAEELSNDIDLNQCQLSLTDCINPIIKLNQQDISRQPKDIPYDIVLSATNLKLHSVRLMQSNSSESGASSYWKLWLSFNGTVTSVRVGATELVPTRLEDILNGSLAQKGGIGLAIIFAIFGTSILLKRAFEKIAEILMPTPLTERTNYVDKQITINASGQGNIINIAEVMADVTNTVNQNITRSAESEDVNKIVKQLAEQITAIATKIDPTIAEQMGSDVKALSEELTKSKPRKAWYEVTLKGLKEAAEAVGEIATPVVATVLKLIPLLLPN